MHHWEHFIFPWVGINSEQPVELDSVTLSLPSQLRGFQTPGVAGWDFMDWEKTSECSRFNPPLLAWCAGPNNMWRGPCSQGHVAVVEAPIAYITFLNKFMQKSGPSVVATAIHAIIEQLYAVWKVMCYCFWGLVIVVHTPPFIYFRLIVFFFLF